MYLALPKNERGALEPAAVCYAVHGYFVQKHGLYVRRLKPAGQSWNSSSQASISRAESQLSSGASLERCLHGEGLSLHEVAVFAATLSDLAHIEAYNVVGAALMMASGYYAELTRTGNLTPRWICWFISMVFFLYLVPLHRSGVAGGPERGH